MSRNRLAVCCAVLTLALVAAPLSRVCAADSAALVAELTGKIDGAAGASDAVKAFAKATLLPLSTNAVFVEAAKAANDKKVSLDEIKALDKKWMDAEEELPIQKEVLGNACAQEIKKIVAANPAVVEVFVMDNQGAVVGENSLTSDYWQGDEEKFTNSFNGGKGGVDVGAVKFDKSANAEIQQVSLPVIGADGTVVGAVTYGLLVGKL